MRKFHFMSEIEKEINSIDPETPRDSDERSDGALHIREIKRILKMLGERIVYDGS